MERVSLLVFLREIWKTTTIFEKKTELSSSGRKFDDTPNAGIELTSNVTSGSDDLSVIVTVTNSEKEDAEATAVKEDFPRSATFNSNADSAETVALYTAQST